MAAAFAPRGLVCAFVALVVLPMGVPPGAAGEAFFGCGAEGPFDPPEVGVLGPGNLRDSFWMALPETATLVLVSAGADVDLYVYRNAFFCFRVCELVGPGSLDVCTFPAPGSGPNMLWIHVVYDGPSPAPAQYVLTTVGSLADA